MISFTQSMSQHARWAILGIAWIMFLASLPAPAYWPGTRMFSAFFGNPEPVYVDLIISFAIPQAFTIWLPAIAFVLSPMFVRSRPHDLAGWAWRVLSLTLLLPWAFPVWFYSASHDDGRIGWGYYLWSIACTVAWIATLLAPSRENAPIRSARFPVIPQIDRSAVERTGDSRST